MTTENILAKLRGVTPLAQNKWLSFCPCHEDSDPSLEIESLADGKTIANCFPCNSAGNPRGFIAGLAVSIGLPQSEFFAAGGGRRGSSASAGGSGSGGKKSRGGGKLPPGAKKVAEWEYRDQDGVVRYKTIRYDLPDGSKEFKQARPNGQGGWIKNLRGVTRIPYRLPELIAANPNAVVWIPEGEKCVDALTEWGEVATCNSGGAGKWLRDHAAYLRGRRVVILPDNDATDPRTGKNAGMDHARDVAASLQGVAASVRILLIPGLPPKGDVFDWKAVGHGRQELLDILAAAEAGGDAGAGGMGGGDALAGINAAGVTVLPPTATDPLSTEFERQCLADLQLDALGEIDGRPGAIKVFSRGRHKVAEIPNLDKLSYDRLLGICGPVVKAKVVRAPDAPPGLYTVSDVRGALALLSGERLIVEGITESGPGIWLGLTDEKSEDGSLVLVGPGEAARYNGDCKLRRIDHPICGGRLLDFSRDDRWYKFGSLAATIDAVDRDFAAAAIKDSIALWGKWIWKGDRDYRCATLMTGLTLASWVQTIFDWRPHVSVIGRSGSGKSILFETLADVFHGLSILSSQSSAAGIRQAIKGSGKIVLCDEFDSTKERNEILEMFRAGSRGDKVYRGTSNQRGTSFTVQHIGWLSGVDSGLKREPDKNRFIRLELENPAEENKGKLVRPPVEFSAALGQRLLAIAIRSALAAKKLSVELKSEKFDGHLQRTIESYAVPVAMLAVALELSRDDTLAMLGRVLTTSEPADAADSDERQLLDAILTSVVRTRDGQISIAQLVQMRYDQRAIDELETLGMSVQDTEDGTKTHFFISYRSVLRNVLRNTRWENMNIEEILARIQGAKKMKCRLSGTRPWGILIPIGMVLGTDDAADAESGPAGDNAAGSQDGPRDTFSG